VHIAIPEESIYSDKDKEVTAAVFLKLKAGGALSPDQVAAITNLVSASIEGLKPNNVSITDTAGNLLSDANSGPMGITGLRQSASQLEMQKQYESQAARDLQIMLEKVLGPGKAVVRVNADLNFDAKQTDSEIYEPISGNQGVLLKDEQVEENYKGGSPNSTAQSASIPATARSANGNGDYSRTESRSQYEVSKRVEHVTEAPGKLRKLSVAVLIDGQPSPTQVNTIRQAVSVAMGIDPTRGDQVTVENLPFDTSAQKEQEKQMKSADNQNLLMNLGKWVGVIVLALLFLFFLRMFLSQMKPVEVTESYSEPLTLKEAEQMLELRSDEEAAPRQVTGRRAAELARRCRPPAPHP
jgi:flagellar M-ring protein FliF